MFWLLCTLCVCVSDDEHVVCNLHFQLFAVLVMLASFVVVSWLCYCSTIS